MLTSNGYTLDETPDRLGELEPVPDRERHDRDALHRRLREEGYLYLRGALDPEASRDFRRYYFNALAESGLTEPGTDPSLGIAGDNVDGAKLRHILFQDIVPGKAYNTFCTQPALWDWYTWFLGGTPMLHRRRIIRHQKRGLPGIGSSTQAHYDWLYLRRGTDSVLSSWIPLGDCPTERGGLTYLERSHLRTFAEEQSGIVKRPAATMTADLPGLADKYDARWLTADYVAGDMVVHNAYIIHAALDNVAEDRVIRLSTDIRYQLSGDAVDQRWSNHWVDGDIKLWQQ